MNAIDFRKDIQVLRGVSVLMVVLFHLELGVYKSGFLGVDIFFVISGYLMALLYQRGDAVGFFVRRARRLLPAYFAVIFFTFAVSTICVAPNEFNQLVVQMLYASGFVSNIGFFLQDSYFDKALFKPLLHLWSLGVEFQFYLLFPVIHWLVTRWRWTYAALMLGSLSLCFLFLASSPSVSFYMMPTRLWEFLAGYGIATYFRKGTLKMPPVARWYGVAGFVVLMSVPLGNIDGAAVGVWHGHPGLVAVLVVILACVVLAVGMPETLLTSPVMSFLGKIGDYSYSIYLVHFPVIVLFMYEPFAGTVLGPGSLPQLAAIIGLVALFSISSYRFIELPFRRTFNVRRFVLGVGVIGVSLVPSAIIYQNARYSQEEMRVARAWEDKDNFRCGLLIRLIDRGAKSCEITRGLSSPVGHVLLVGNSHANSIKAVFASVAEKMNVSVRFMVKNNSLMKGGMGPEEIVREAVFRGINQIVLHYSSDAVSSDTVNRLADMAAEKSISVSYILPVPMWSEHVPRALWRNLNDGTPLPVMTVGLYMERNGDFIRGLTKGMRNLRVHEVAGIYCPRNLCNMMDEDGRPLYFDAGHLTISGSELMRGLFEDVLREGKNRRNLG